MTTLRGGAVFLALTISACVAQFASPLLLAQEMTPEQAAKRLAALKIEYHQTLAFLEESYRQRWTQEEFQKALNAKSIHLQACDRYIQTLLRPRAIWDERPPFRMEVSQAIAQCHNERDLAVQMLTLRAGATR
jgi:hypothetical protein